MDYLELKYVNLVSFKLRNFKQRSSSLLNFSCPYCGDSSNKQRRARGYILEKNGSTVYYCHNCNMTRSVEQLIQYLDEGIYNEYLFEKFKGSNQKKDDLYNVDFSVEKKVFDNKILSKIKKVSQLPFNHPVKNYILSRKIPSKLHFRLYYCPRFMAWTNTIIPYKFSEQALPFDEPRLLIPFWNKEGNIHAFQGRSFKKKTDTKYITIVLDESTPKLYGLDTLDPTDTIYVTEGPIDSLFIPNCVATAGGDIVSQLSNFDKNNMIIIFDNEPRSPETRHKLDKAIEQGYNVCIFPEKVIEKDINAMIQSGYSRRQVKALIDENTYSGLEAQLKLASWSKRI